MSDTAATQTSRNRRRLISAGIAIMVLVLLGAAVWHLSSDYHQTFRLRNFKPWNLAIAFSFAAAALLVCIVLPWRVLLAIAACVITLIPFSYPIQEQATLNVSQRMSFAFIVGNAPAFAPMLPPWVLPTIAAGFILAAFIVGWALMQVVRIAGRPASAAVLVVSTAALWVNAIYYYPSQQRYLNWDPMLSLFGYSPAFAASGRQMALEKTERQALEALNMAKPIDGTKRNVIIFMGDSLNPDHMAEFGYHRDTVPFLSEVRSAYPFFNAYIGRSTCAESICGVMSTFASRRFGDLPPFQILGLGTVLQKYGYDVHFVLVGDHRRYAFGSYGTFIKDQSTTIYDYTLSELSLNDDNIAIEGLEQLPQANGKPALIFVFFFSSHVLGKEFPEFAKYGPFLNRRYSFFKSKYSNGFPRSVRRVVRNHYDNKLQQLSHFMSEGFSILKRKGYTQNSELIFLGDHGEATGEGLWIGHRELTEGGLRIPLVWASTEPLPLPPADRTTPREIDIAPTVLTSLGLPIPPVWQGEAFRERRPGDRFFHEYGIASLRRGEDCRAVYGSLIGYEKGKFLSCTADVNGNRRREFYNISKDPHERKNLWGRLSAEQRQSLGSILDHGPGSDLPDATTAPAAKSVEPAEQSSRS